MSAWPPTHPEKDVPDVEEDESPAMPAPRGMDAEEPIPHVHAKTFVLIFAVYLVYLAGGYNIVVAGAFGREVGIALNGLSDSTWLVQTVTIIISVLSPVVGEAADLWGRKWLLVGMSALGVVGCVVTGAATSMGMALGGQVISGVACSSQPLVHAIPSEVVPRRYRPIVQGGVNVSIALAAIIGILAGGALTKNNHNFGFRALWYINAGLFGVATVTIALLYNPPLRETQKQSQRAKLANMDWIGILLLSSGLTLFCMALTWSQNPYPWGNAHIAATFAIGCVLLIGLAVYEIWFKKDGMFHHALFKQGRNFPLAVGGIFIEGMVFFAVNNYLAFEISTLYEHDAMITAVRFSIGFYVFIISTVSIGFICTYTKRLRLPLVFGYMFFLSFFVTMATAEQGSSTAVWGYPVLFGAGLGILLNTLMTVAQLCTPPELIAPASGLMLSTRSIGASVGLAIYNAIFTHLLTSNLNSKVPAAVIPLGLPPTSIGALIGAFTSGDTSGLSQIPGITNATIGAGGNAVLASFVVAFRYVWVTAGCFAFVAMLVAAIGIVDPSEEFNTHIDAPAESEEALYERKIDRNA